MTPGRRSRIGRPRSKGREGRRRNTAGAELRGGGLVGDAQSGTPGVVSTQVWVGWSLRGTCSSPGHLDGHGEGLSGEGEGGGLSARRHLPTCACARCAGLGSECWRVCGWAQSQRQLKQGPGVAVRGSPRRARGEAAAPHRRGNVLGSRACYKACKLAQREQGGLGVLTQAWVCRSYSGATPAASSVGRRGGA